MKSEQLEDCKKEFSSLCELTQKTAEEHFKIFSELTPAQGDLVLRYYTFTGELLKLTNAIDVIMSKLSAIIQQADAANDFPGVSETHKLFEICAAYRKNAEAFLTVTESAKSDQKAFISVLKAETDKLIRKTILLKGAI